MAQEITPIELKAISEYLHDEAFIELAYYNKLYLYVDSKTGELFLKPTGVLGLEPVAEMWKEDFYTKQYFTKRKRMFLDIIKKRPFQKARECSLLAGEIVKQMISRQEKIFLGLEFFNGYSSAYNDFLHEPMKWTNLGIAKNNIRQREKLKLYDASYERDFAYIQFYEDLQKDKERRQNKNGS